MKNANRQAIPTPRKSIKTLIEEHQTAISQLEQEDGSEITPDQYERLLLRYRTDRIRFVLLPLSIAAASLAVIIYLIT